MSYLQILLRKIHTLILFFVVLIGMCSCLVGEVVISEFLADNETSLKDEDGDEPDWIELENRGTTAVALEGWALTDNAENPSKWLFPAVVLAEGERLVIFASGKDRGEAAGELHTNFKLSADGEYLALIRANGAVASQYFPEYPKQIEDVSYGFGTTSEVLISEETSFSYHLPQSEIGNDWLFSGFEDPNNLFVEGTGLGLGYDLTPDYLPFIETSVPAGTLNAYVRIPFQVSEPSNIASLVLELAYDDAFVFWINGNFIEKSFGVPSNPTYNSFAPFDVEADPAEPQVFNLDSVESHLQNGENILAIQVLNSWSDSDDFFVRAKLTAIRNTTTVGHLSIATPGQANAEVFEPGPEILDVEFLPALPTDEDSIVVSAKIEPRFGEVASVSLHYRVMFDEEVVLPMNDNGVLGDLNASDGIFSALIPASAAGPEEMVRWRVVGADNGGRETVSPLFSDQTGTNQSPQYYGTMIAAETEINSLPIYYWFCDDYTRAHNRSGARSALFYEGRFYENIYVRARGGVTNSDSQKFEFNKGDSFQPNDDVPAVAEINMNASGRDASYLRQPLAFDTFEAAGAPGSMCYPVQLRYNGTFNRVALHTEQVDDDYLKRQDLPEDGALYKFVQRSNRRPALNDVVTGVEKKTRKEESSSDLLEFINGLKQSLANVDREKDDSLIYTEAETEARHRFLFDNVNVPIMVNYSAVQILTQDTDDTRKNFYLYRDTDGTGEWFLLPWDKDLTFGLGAPHTLLSKHPLWADAQHKNSKLNQWNILFDALHNDPHIREMILRRARTLMDELYKPAVGSSGVFFEPRALELESLIDPVFEVDSTELHSELDERRMELYFSNVYGAAAPNLIPAEASANLVPIFGFIETGSTTSHQGEEFVEIENPHSEAIDLSGWSLEGGIEFTFEGGTVVPAGEKIYLSPSPFDFRNRVNSPRGDEGLLVVGPYGGKLSNWGEDLTLVDAVGMDMGTITTPIVPSLAQEFLVISEVNYHPAGNSEAEFIELFNRSSSVTLDLLGVTLSGGVEFSFVDASMTLLAPGARVLLVRNTAAFASVYGSGLPVIGVYSGALNNSGEKIKLDDASGSTIVEFDYSPMAPWPLSADGEGSTLVLVSPEAQSDASDPSNWQRSQQVGGNPGGADGPYFSFWERWQQLHFSPSQLADPLVSGRSADPDGDGRNNMSEWSFATLPLVGDEAQVEFAWVETSEGVREAIRLHRPRTNRPATYQLLAGQDLELLEVVPADIEVTHTLEETEIVDFVPAQGATLSRRFLQVQAIEGP